MLLSGLGAVVGVILVFMPWMIYNELRRQGEARRAEALKIVSLLSALSNRPTDAERAIAEASRLQAIADAKAKVAMPRDGAQT